MIDDFDHLEQGYMTIMEYEACYYALFSNFYACISTKSKKILKFVNGFDCFNLSSYDSDGSVWVIISEYSRSY